MRIIGNKLLEVTKLKQALVLFFFASLLFPQFNINQITHPLDDQSPVLRDKDKSYISINSDSHFEIPDMLNQFDDLPDWIDRYQLRNPMSWHLVSMGSGDVFYVFASDENSEIYSLLYSDNYWGMNSDNSFSDHWIDFTTGGSFILSFNGSAYAQSQEPIDITINGLYPEMTLEDVLLLYQNLFNIDANNWKQTIGGD